MTGAELLSHEVSGFPSQTHERKLSQKCASTWLLFGLMKVASGNIMSPLLTEVTESTFRIAAPDPLSEEPEYWRASTTALLDTDPPWPVNSWPWGCCSLSPSPSVTTSRFGQLPESGLETSTPANFATSAVVTRALSDDALTSRTSAPCSSCSCSIITWGWGRGTAW